MTEENLVTPPNTRSVVSPWISFARNLRKISREFGWPSLVILFLSPGVFIGPETWSPTAVGAGTFLMLAGLGLRLWSKGFQRDEGFVLDGPYRYVANPVECGAMLVYLGSALLLHVHWIAILSLAAAGLAYLSVCADAFDEDRFSHLGGLYLRYRRRVSRWIPSRLPGVNRSRRTYLFSSALKSERLAIYWFLALLIVVVLRQTLHSYRWMLL